MKAKKIQCKNCGCKFDPKRYGHCPDCSEVVTLAVIHGKSSNNPQAVRAINSRIDKKGKWK